MNASSYDKIRLYYDELRILLEQSGFLIQADFTEYGMAYILCVRNS